MTRHSLTLAFLVSTIFCGLVTNVGAQTETDTTSVSSSPDTAGAGDNGFVTVTDTGYAV